VLLKGLACCKNTSSYAWQFFQPAEPTTWRTRTFEVPIWICAQERRALWFQKIPKEPELKLMKLSKGLLAISLLTAFVSADAKIITVTTEDNVSPGVGQTSLVQALNQLKDGDTIQFNIPGTGVHYLKTPVDGYPLITANGITIDGYSQPGAAPNSNPLHASNNAQLMIALSSTNGNGLSMQTAITNYSGIANDNLGFGPDELAILGVFRGTNVTIRGLAFISAPEVTGSGFNGDMKSIAICPDSAGQCANWHVSGCWFGIDPATRQAAYMPDGTTVAMPAISIAAYRSRDPDGTNPTYAQPGTIGVAAGSTNPAAEFNVFVTGYGFDSEGLNYRISGNFWNVLPDGMHNFDPSMANAGQQQGDGYIEIGRVDDNILIGTDGDGVNDAYEGNVFGGVASTDWANLYLWSAHATNIVVAGNWFGLAVDGVTRFTNSSVVVHSFPASAQARFGSDFDGVSDALEANLLYNNNPFSFVYHMLTNGLQFSPVSAFDGTGPSSFGGLNPGVRLSFRGNVTINNNLLPDNYADGSLDLISPFMNYEAPYMDTSSASAPADIIPSLNTNSTVAHVRGIFPVGLAPYTNIFIDVYQADPEGWNNGKVWAEFELTDSFSYTNGFPQGSQYLKSFTVANSGSFDLDLTGLNLGNGLVTVTANYSADPAGTRNGRTHTSNFSDPLALSVPIQPLVVGISKAGASIVLSWPVSAGLFKVQSTQTVASSGSWADLAPQPTVVQVGANYQATLTVNSGVVFYRLRP